MGRLDKELELAIGIDIESAVLLPLLLDAGLLYACFDGEVSSNIKSKSWSRFRSVGILDFDLNGVLLFMNLFKVNNLVFFVDCTFTLGEADVFSSWMWPSKLDVVVLEILSL